MLLPINLFNNLTAYTKTNWQCGLGPEQEITWSPYAVSTVENWSKLNVVAKGNYTKLTFKDEATDANYIAGAIYANVSSYQGWIPVYKITFKSKEAMDDFGPAANGINCSFWGLELQSITLTAYWVDEKNLVAYYIFSPDTLKYLKSNKGQHFRWFAVDGAKPIDKAHCKSLEIQMVPVDWLAAGKKATISVRDKLGLVYWDGTFTPNTGASIQIKPADLSWAYLTAREDADKGLSLYTADGTRTFREPAGTINLSGLNATVTVIETTGDVCLKDHIWHVI